MRIRLFKPDYQIDDIDVITNGVYPDSERVEDSDIFDNNIPEQTRELDEKTKPHEKQTHSCTLKDRSAAITSNMADREIGFLKDLA